MSRVQDLDSLQLYEHPTVYDDVRDEVSNGFAFIEHGDSLFLFAGHISSAERVQEGPSVDGFYEPGAEGGVNSHREANNLPCQRIIDRHLREYPVHRKNIPFILFRSLR